MRLKNKTYMFAHPGDLNCPVYHYKRYLSLLHPHCPALFQHAKKKFALTRVNDAKIPLGYNNAPVGYHTLLDFMKKMVDGGGLQTIHQPLHKKDNRQGLSQ